MGQSAITHCPICQRNTADAFRPFCSKRCADVDLGRWFGEHYSVPTNESIVDDTTSDEESS